MYFLSDRRQKLTGAIKLLGAPLPSESSFPPLSAVSAFDLHRLPSIPMTEYDPEQLLRMAQIVYTGLLKVYLVARPILVGSLCRIENWCDVDEVEELLKAQKVGAVTFAEPLTGLATYLDGAISNIRHRVCSRSLLK
jgi:hypothetical protein